MTASTTRTIRVAPVGLNSAIARLFMVGASCFAIGVLPSYSSAVGSAIGSLTFFIGSLFFTSASYLQLLQAQTPAMTDVAARAEHEATPLVMTAWKWRDRNWVAAATQFPGTLCFNVSTAAAMVTNLASVKQDRYVWRPDYIGSVLFLVSSAFAIASLEPGTRIWRPHERGWQIAWLNMIGSIAFMLSAIGSFVDPDTGNLKDQYLANVGTFVGAVCFFAGAALMPSAWRRSVTAAG